MNVSPRSKSDRERVSELNCAELSVVAFSAQQPQPPLPGLAPRRQRKVSSPLEHCVALFAFRAVGSGLLLQRACVYVCVYQQKTERSGGKGIKRKNVNNNSKARRRMKAKNTHLVEGGQGARRTICFALSLCVCVYREQ